MTTQHRAEPLRSYSIPEYGTAEIDITPTIAADMHRDGHLSVAPCGPPDRYAVTARHKVGVLRYADVELRIVPKVTVGRLLYLASNIDDGESWRELEALLGTADDPLSAITHALVHHAERALRPAPLQGYVTHETAERRLRGRVLFDRQISRRAGVLLPVELRYDEYEVNIVENRLLKAAIGIVEQHCTDSGLARRLAHLRFRLDGVAPWPTGESLPVISFTRLNERYRAALALARLVLERRSLEFPDQTQRGSAFLFNMNHVFESYVEAAMRLALEARGGQVHGQRPTYLDEADTVVMKPDVTWWFAGRCVAVIDAKYKRTVNSDYPNADAYQMLAYCTRLGLRRGLLIYADTDGRSGGSTTVRNAGIEIVVTSLNLSGSIDELRSNVDELAALVATGNEALGAVSPALG